MMQGPYSHGIPFLLWKHFHPEKPIAHQQTCPVCGRGLVNLYKRNGVWKCRRCWEEETA